MEAADRALKDAAERAEENAALLKKTVLTIPQQAGDDGRLFGSSRRRTSSTPSVRPAA